MEKEYINPAGVYKHPGYTRVITVKGPMKFIFMAGQTPSDENYQAVSPGDLKAQYIKVMENLDIQLKAVGASWDDIVFRRIFATDVDAYMKLMRDPGLPVFGDPAKPPPGTLIGVTRLSYPDFMLEIEVLAVVAA